MARNLAILGSTGSIGRNTLDVVRAHPDRLSVKSLAAGKQWKRLAEQVREFRPRLVAVYEPEAAARLRDEIRGIDVAVREGMPGLLEAASLADADTLVSALVGSIGLRPVMVAIASGKTICLANKETLVVAGALVTAAAQEKGVPIIPVDSEHSAIFQCLADGNRDASQIRRLVLTASGGPFRRLETERLAGVTPGEALRHPNWDMGGKITIDSATLMNKGLEVIEARWLFGIEFDRIEVVVHPQSIIHSLVEFIDGSFLGQLGAPDMRLPIQYALSYPDRWQASGDRLDLLKLGSLTFEPPRLADFPCLAYAYEAGRRGGTLPCAMNAANEVAVAAFLQGDIGFTDIPAVIRAVMDMMPFEAAPDLDALLAHDEQARGMAAVRIAERAAARQKGAEAA
ncbi:MAG TPA: 1-deoxy-D-xylulose-5-phosphate reductoisomerase [Candidatus Ozemobacteraceae bacterium]|nr:1-deoxy-D-xylulose-5-phosphate reductoisomerase [Candidatus Ozemobacteraceae bacterium]